MLTFATLGPDGSNHAYATGCYLSFLNVRHQKIVLFEGFNTALAALAAGEADYMVQVAVHPDAARIVADAHFKHEISIVDVFISPSRPLAVLTRREVQTPRTIAVMPATRDYTDLSSWEMIVDSPSTGVIASALEAGEFDSGLTWRALAEEQPDRFRIDIDIGTVDDAWMVFGRTRPTADPLIAWRNSPGARQIRRLSE